MIAAMVTLLTMMAGVLVIVSGLLPESAGTRLRECARNLFLIAIALPMVVALVGSVPRGVLLGVFVTASALAFFALQYRCGAQRAQHADFVNYRASGKVPVRNDNHTELEGDQTFENWFDDIS